mgnify:CR=1 FL=1
MEYTYDSLDKSLPDGFYDKQAMLYIMDAKTERFFSLLPLIEIVQNAAQEKRARHNKYNYKNIIVYRFSFLLYGFRRNITDQANGPVVYHPDKVQGALPPDIMIKHDILCLQRRQKIRIRCGNTQKRSWRRDSICSV